MDGSISGTGVAVLIAVAVTGRTAAGALPTGSRSGSSLSVYKSGEGRVDDGKRTVTIVT